MSDQAGKPRVIIVGAGILGLASAYHILRANRALDLLVVDRWHGAGQGNTARSAAGFRDMFSSSLNRALSRGSIAFYEKVQAEADIGLQLLGYLWLVTAAQMPRFNATLAAMAAAGVKFEQFSPAELRLRLPEMEAGTIAQGILGRNCGILNPNLLCRFYEKEILALGGKFAYGVEVTGFPRDGRSRIYGVKLGEQVVSPATVVVAAGAWMNLTLKLAGLEIPVVPRKRQLFVVAAKSGPQQRLLHTKGFNSENLLPLTNLPGGAYLRPTTGAFILGYANPDQPPGMEEHPAADPDFFVSRVRPQIVSYFPAFREAVPDYAWAGHYADHLADSQPIVDRVGGAIVVGGPSGSGIMKADGLGRITAGLYFGRDWVELEDGTAFQVADLGMTDRRMMPEELVI